MNLRTFLTLAQKYADLGDAVQTQLRAVAEVGPIAIENQNPAALRMASDRLLRDIVSVTHDDELADEVRDLLAVIEGANDDDLPPPPSEEETGRDPYA